MTEEQPRLEADRPEDRAVELLYRLADRVKEKRPLVLSRRAAFRLVFPQAGAQAWTPEHADYLVQFSRSSSSMYVHRLGPVKLDSFLVEAATGRPEDAHWDRVRYGREEWEYVLGAAELLAE